MKLDKVISLSTNASHKLRPEAIKYTIPKVSSTLEKEEVGEDLPKLTLEHQQKTTNRIIKSTLCVINAPGRKNKTGWLST